MRMGGVSLAGWALAIGLAMFCDHAQAQSPSTFQESCRDIRADGVMLSALCRRIDGSWNPSRIPIRGIENIDGVLRFTGAPHSTYAATCTDIRASGAVLLASCRRVNGTWSRTSVLIPSIENINGVLRYQP